MKVECFLILGVGKGDAIRVRRATTRYPALDSDEAVVRLSLDVPDDIFEAPLLTVPVERNQVAVAVEALTPEQPE